LLSLLLCPLNQSLLLVLLAICLLLLHRPRAALAALVPAAAWLWLCSTAIFADALMTTLEKDYPPRAISVTPQADAIVVLGGATRGDTHMGTLGDLNQQADRLVHATELYKAQRAPLLLLTGGAQAGERPEADLMRELLMVMGVPQRAMLLERSSRTTFENAAYSAPLLQARGIRRILLVTSAFHMRRARALFEERGFEVIPAPTDYQCLVAEPLLPRWLPAVDHLARSTHALHEHAGYWIYRLQGRL
jgi:uncharacterized SAM-binding protein YcdF (DUF218 family)